MRVKDKSSFYSKFWYETSYSKLLQYDMGTDLLAAKFMRKGKVMEIFAPRRTVGKYTPGNLEALLAAYYSSSRTGLPIAHGPSFSQQMEGEFPLEKPMKLWRVGMGGRESRYVLAHSPEEARELALRFYNSVPPVFPVATKFGEETLSVKEISMEKATVL